MLAQYLDLTEEATLSGDNSVVIDVSNYDYCLVQPIGVNAALSSTIDGGALQGVTDGNSVSATNFISAAAINITNGNSYTATITDGDIGKLEVVGRYVKIDCVGAPTKLLVMLAKIG